MTSSESFLDKEPEELEQFLLQLARQDSAPQAARERALLQVTSAAAGIGLLSVVTSYGARSSWLKASTWLATKWLAAGLGAGLLSIAAVQGVEQWAAGPARSERSAERSASARKQAGQSVRPSVASPLRVPQEEQLRPPAITTPDAPLPAAGSTSLPAAAGEVSLRARTRHVTSAAAPSPVVSPDAASSLTRELALLEAARGALSRRAPAPALRALSDYAAQFPNGSLQVEAAALRVEAVGQAGNLELARQLADSFLANYPTSPLAARVRAESAEFRVRPDKP